MDFKIPVQALEIKAEPVPFPTTKVVEHIAEVLIEQGYLQKDAQLAAVKIATKCKAACR